MTPIDPRLRILLIAVRRALLILADGLAEYCELPKAKNDVQYNQLNNPPVARQ